ncbi:MAG: hypothetical protein WBM15_11235, partial [Chromatiaceae bacterium]
MKFANAILSWCLLVLASLTLLSCDQGSQNPTSVGAGGERSSATTELAAAAGQSGETGSQAAAIVRREKLATPDPTAAQIQAPVARQLRQT